MSAQAVVDRLEHVRRAGPGKWRAQCPAHDGKSHASLSVRETDDGHVLLFCFAGCAPAEIADAVGLTMSDLFPDASDGKTRRAMPPPLRVVRPEEPAPVLSMTGAALWTSCQSIDGDARSYLLARGAALPPADGHLRCARLLPHSPSYRGAALVGLITNAVTGQPQSLHFTWVRPDGRKADVDPPRRYLKDHRKAGGVVRLWPDEEVTGGLAIAEGIETALTAAHAFRPVWACLDAGNVAAFPVLDGIESLLIIADHDAAGLSAADQCAERWMRAGREVRVVVPPNAGEDLNDLVQVAA